MAQAVGKYAAKKLLSSELSKHSKRDPSDQYDPYYTWIEDPRRPGKKKKVKKQIPDYLSDNDAMVLAKVRKRAYWLDCSLFTFLGQRFGWSSVVGIIPFIGDGADAGMAYLFVYRNCAKIDGGLPASVQMAMLLNIALDFVVGLIPFLGDMLDALFRANSRNVRELEKYLDKKYKPKEVKERQDRIRREKRASGMRYESPPPATVYEDMDGSVLDWDGETVHADAPAGAAGQQSGITGQQAETTPTQHAATRPTPAAAPPPRKGSWFSRGGGSKARPDVEMGGDAAGR